MLRKPKCLNERLYYFFEITKLTRKRDIFISTFANGEYAVNFVFENRKPMELTRRTIFGSLLTRSILLL